jgi:hypothetical protein
VAKHYLWLVDLWIRNRGAVVTAFTRCGNTTERENAVTTA